MEIQERLAPLVDQARTKIDHAVIAVELKALKAPRPLKDLSNKSLDRLLEKFGIGVVVATYSLASNKALNFGLKDRRLNKFGCASIALKLALSVPFVLLLIHERWVRSETPMSPEQFMDQLLHGEDLKESFLR